MPLLLREIKRLPLWDLDDVPRLQQGEFPARAYADLHAPDNCLSFWRWDEDESLQQRLIAALVCKSGTLRTFAYVLLQEDAITKLGCSVVPTVGVTDDKPLNDAHVDATELSGADAHQVGRLILAAIQESLNHLEQDEVLDCIAFSRDNGFLGRTIPKPIAMMLAAERPASTS